MDYEISGENVEMLTQLAVTYGLKILGAAAIFVIGRYVVKLITALAKKAMTRSRLDDTLTVFAGNILYIILMALVVIAALEQIGVETTSFAALVAAAGLAIGLALQGSLSNFASGVLMILFRPVKLGDYVSAGGTDGTVSDIGIFTTTLMTPDNKTIIVPNGKIMSDNIVNYSAQPTRRADFVFDAGYGDDIDKVKAALSDVVTSDARVLKDPEHVIVVGALGESSIKYTVRAWVKTEDYWDFVFATNEAVKKRFDKEGFSIPYPQRDVHHYNETGLLKAG